MQYLELGRSGLRISELCLGAMTFGEEMGIGAPVDECRRVYESFLEAGGNFIDTANIYNRGTSESILGEFIGSERDRLVLASKYSLSTNPADPNAGGNHRKNLQQALDASLRRLQTDYLDIYWVHGWDRSTPLAEMMRALDDQVRAGKILHVGISNAPAWVVSAANVLAAERNMTPFCTLQLHYNLVERSIEEDFLDLALAQDMLVTAWSPLAGGLLTGKFNRDSDPDARAGSRLESTPMGARVITDHRIDVAEQLTAVAADLDCSPAQLALAWLRQRGEGRVVPIIGARNAAQLADNLGAVQLELPAETIAQLDELTAPEWRYPRTLLDGEFFQQMMFGAQRAQRRRGGGL
ncbi:MAG: aldo/keto reductase [Gammaproteobacteria bacterium]|nr:aldo/keto reductase [Gammaproteobacteria bacterium]